MIAIKCFEKVAKLKHLRVTLAGACKMHGKDERCIQRLSENLKERGHFSNLGVDGRIILE
jgi:hypothetical protein